MTAALTIRAAALGAIAALAGCAVATDPPPVEDGASRAAAHVAAFRQLDNPADDPGSDGERRAIEYAAAHFRSLGLHTVVQTVPLVRMIPTTATVTLTGPNGLSLTASSPSDRFIIWPGKQAAQVTVDAPLVFAGYGIVSPEYQRDDYKRIDAAGKVVIVLEGTPRTGNRSDLGTLGDTYYGTRQYKYAEAARHGAAGVLILHDADEEPWSDLQREATGSILDIDASTTANPGPKCDIEGWLSLDTASRLLAMAGETLDSFRVHARELGFRPRELPVVRATIRMDSRLERLTSQDVVAILPGRHPDQVLLAGRWNRIDPDVWASRTFRSADDVADEEAGAMTSHLDDDGSGAGAVMEAARRLTAPGEQPLRTIVFMVATALKPGLIGLEHYVEHPVAAGHIQAMIVMDRADLSGATHRLGKIGTASDPALAQIARVAAMDQGRLVELDENRHRRFYYKFGQAAIARSGVRQIVLTSRPEEDGSTRRMRHIVDRDRIVGFTDAPAVSAVRHPRQDAALLARMTHIVANATNWPPRNEPIGGR